MTDKRRSNPRGGQKLAAKPGGRKGSKGGGFWGTLG
jgi:hypothetical protein